MSPTMTGTRAHWNTAVGGDGKNEIGGEVAIARPPDEVFDVLVDPRNEPRYNRRMLRAEKVTPGPIGVGTRFRQVATGLGRRGETVTELTGCDRPRRLTYRIGSAAMDITGEETLEPVAGGTLVRWSWGIRPRGVWRAASPVLRVGGARLERRVWADLKRYLEQVPGRWPPVGRRDPVPVAPDVYAVTVGRGIGLLASNLYLLRSAESWALVDAGWAGDADEIRRAAESVFGAGARPRAILLTHIHPDHSGAAGDLARAWGVPVYVHPDELPMTAGKYRPEFDMPLDHWVIMPIMRLLPAKTRSRVEAAGDITDVTRSLEQAGVVPGVPDWQWVATPGHTPGQVAYLRPADGVLISGDAVVTVNLNSISGLLRGRQGLAGPPRYTTWNWPTARRSMAVIASLNPQTLLPGHGHPLTVRTAEALHDLARDSQPVDRRTADRLLVPLRHLRVSPSGTQRTSTQRRRPHMPRRRRALVRLIRSRGMWS